LRCEEIPQSLSGKQQFTAETAEVAEVTILEVAAKCGAFPKAGALHPVHHWVQEVAGDFIT